MRVLCLLFLCSQLALAGFEQRRVGARPSALGEAYVAMSGDAWSVFYNPAGLSSLASPVFSAFYSPRPLGFPELSVRAAAGSVPAAAGVFGAGALVYGFELYREVSGILTYSQTLSGISAGIALSYHHVSIARYGSAAALGVDAGIVVPLSGGLAWGAVGRNLNASSIGSSGERLPLGLATGFAYTPFGRMSVLLDVEKEQGFAASPRGGVEIRVLDAISLRGGITDQPEQVTAGIGIRVGFVGFDYSFVSHEELGGSHEISITVR